MKTASRPRLAICVLSLSVLTACVSGGDRYPDLNMRDFERVQGTFAAAGSTTEQVRPDAIGAKSLAEIESALAQAGEQHAKFLTEAERARPIVRAAAGTGIEDNRWPVAQIEIAALESRNGEMASLLAYLDSLYADASFNFTERKQIETARDAISGYHAAQRRIIANLVSTLGATDRP